MDPLTVLSLVETCAGLAVTAGKLAIGLKSLADSYRSSALLFRSLSNQCRLFSTAVRAIQSWMEDAPDTSSIDDRIWEQLGDSLECANDAIYALEEELVRTSNGTVNTFWDKVNVIWNLDGLRELQDCIHKQITGLGVILQIMNLPTRQCQTDGLSEQSSVFQESRSSAMSFRDPDASTIKGGGDEASTLRPASTILTNISQMPRFDFEDMLLTSQVYLRNRNKTLALNSTTSNSSKTQDMSTGVSSWDLPPMKSEYGYTPDYTIDLSQAAGMSGSKEELMEFVEGHVLRNHATLVDKYKKVKRYYFERMTEVEELKKEMANLKTKDRFEAGSNDDEGDRDQMWQKHLERTQNGELTSMRKQHAEQQQELQKLQKQVEWQQVQLSYWNGHQGSGGVGAVSQPLHSNLARR
jgi:hypothetical protein